MPRFLTNSSFVRPADITAYAAGDLVANDTVAASVVVPNFPVTTRHRDRNAAIHNVQLRKSGAATDSASFRVHFFSAEPTNIVNGDNGAFSVSGVDDYIGSVDVVVDQAFGDGAWGAGEFVAGSEPLFREAENIYWLLEALAAYTPADAEEFRLQVEVNTHE